MKTEAGSSEAAGARLKAAALAASLGLAIAFGGVACAASTSGASPPAPAAPGLGPLTPGISPSQPGSQNATVIPSAVSAPQPQNQQSVNDQANHATDWATNAQIQSYQSEGDQMIPGPPLHSLQEFIQEGITGSPLGVEVREDRRELNDGAEAEGLLIVNVVKDSPAEKAGLRAYSHNATDVAATAAVVGAVFFPPAIILVPLVAQVHVLEAYDLIIGVDGNRVTNVIDFEDAVQDARPGEVVYLNIVRNGKRMQVGVAMPAKTAAN